MAKDDLRDFSQLLKEMGFNPSRPLSTQQAFLKHLLKAAQELEPVNPTEVQSKPGEQLAFDLRILGTQKR